MTEYKLEVVDLTTWVNLPSMKIVQAWPKPGLEDRCLVLLVRK